MKTKNFVSIIIILISISLLSGSHASAQDFVKANPKYTKILTDTLGVRMIKVSLPPGAELAMHTHPVEMLYCLQGGILRVNYKSGRIETDTIKTGDYYQGPIQEAHGGKNIGKTNFVFLEIEVKPDR